MSALVCPHCGKDVDLVGQRELTEEYGMGPNPVAHARQLGLFPLPVLSFGNRNMWLRQDIDNYVEERSRERIAKLVEDFEKTISVLPDSEKELAAPIQQAAKELLKKR